MTKIDLQFYEGLAKEFVGKVGRLNHFIKHPLLIGQYHEEVLKNTIKAFLPERYSIKTGFVFVDKETVSKQIDILVIDENEPTSYFFQEGNFVIVHPDAVVCGIEVKTHLDKSAFEDAVENIKSLRQMSYNSSYKKAFGGMVFAYYGTELTPQITDSWWKAITDIPEDINLYPNKIFVLEKGSIDLRPKNDQTKEKWGHYFVMGEEKDEYKVKSLSIFFQSIRKFTELKAGKISNPFAYADFTDLCWTKEYLRFGKGLLSP